MRLQVTPTHTCRPRPSRALPKPLKHTFACTCMQALRTMRMHCTFLWLRRAVRCAVLCCAALCRPNDADLLATAGYDRTVRLWQASARHVCRIVCCAGHSQSR